MSIHNQYADISLTVAEIHSLSEQFDAIRAITDTLPEIDPLIMRHVAKMGAKTQSFSRDTFMLAAQRQHLLPRGLDLEAIEELFKKRDALQSCLVQAKHLAKHLELLLRLVGSDLFSAALAAYKAMKTNDRNAASDPVLKELSRTFSRTKRRKKEEEAEQAELDSIEKREAFGEALATEVVQGKARGSATLHNDAFREPVGCQENPTPTQRSSTVAASLASKSQYGGIAEDTRLRKADAEEDRVIQHRLHPAIGCDH